MGLRYPKFTNSYCKAFTACGELKDADDSLKSWLTSQDTMAIRYRASGCLAHISFFCGGKRGSHLHFDVSLPDWHEGSFPKATHKRTEIEKVVFRAKDMKIDISVIAYMKMPKNEVSHPIFSLLDEQEVTIGEDDKVQLKFRGLELESLGLSFGKIFINEMGDDYFITFRFTQEAIFDDEYLPFVLNRIDAFSKDLFDGND